MFCFLFVWAIICLLLLHYYIFVGVRALLIDKDQNPNWNPPSLEEVSEDLVNNHFKDVDGSEELVHKLWVGANFMYRGF